jgi:hypothetical protein
MLQVQVQSDPNTHQIHMILDTATYRMPGTPISSMNRRCTSRGGHMLVPLSMNIIDLRLAEARNMQD